MNQNFDLHCHTTASDGTLAPEQVVELAAESGIRTLAITDHDNVNGVTAAAETGKKLGVNVIPGVEISIDYSPGTMHLCGYFIDIHNEKLNKGLAFVQEARRTRNPRIVQKLNDLGLDITIDEIAAVAGDKQLGRPHFAKVMVDKGYVSSTQEAFDKYLAKGAPAYLDKARLDLKTSVEMIRDAGGVPVLAHPIQLKLKTDKEYLDLFQEMKVLGVVGIEGYTGQKNKEENAYFCKLIRQVGMVVSAGSDFHGATKPNVKLGEFGENVDVTIDEILTAFQAQRV